jgi:uncharacterized protein YpmB
MTKFKANRKNILAILVAVLAIAVAIILILLNINKPKQSEETKKISYNQSQYTIQNSSF